MSTTEPIRHAAKKLLSHVGHAIECVTYGSPPMNVSVECVDCNMVLTDEELFENDSDVAPISGTMSSSEQDG